MNECLFCKFVKKDLPARLAEVSAKRAGKAGNATEIVFENDVALAFLDIMPRAPGHTMVIPKQHARNISELPDEAVGPFFQTVKRVIAQIERALAPDGFTLGMNYGEASGQEVQHLHFHIIPRWHGDGGGTIQRVVENKPSEDIAVIAQKIRG